jgi:hypothetical protein
MLRFFFSAISISSSASLDEAVKGFSTQMCLPDSRAFFAKVKCVSTGVEITIIS